MRSDPEVGKQLYLWWEIFRQSWWSLKSPHPPLPTPSLKSFLLLARRTSSLKWMRISLIIKIFHGFCSERITSLGKALTLYFREFSNSPLKPLGILSSLCCCATHWRRKKSIKKVFPSKNKVESNPLLKDKKDDLGLTSLQCEKPLVPKLWAPSVVSEGRQLRRGVMTWGFRKWLCWWQKNTLISRVAFMKVGIRPGSSNLSKNWFTSPSCSHHRCRSGSYKPLSPAKPDQFVQ